MRSVKHLYNHYSLTIWNIKSTEHPYQVNRQLRTSTQYPDHEPQAQESRRTPNSSRISRPPRVFMGFELRVTTFATTIRRQIRGDVGNANPNLFGGANVPVSPDSRSALAAPKLSEGGQSEPSAVKKLFTSVPSCSKFPSLFSVQPSVQVQFANRSHFSTLFYALPPCFLWGRPHSLAAGPKLSTLHLIPFPVSALYLQRNFFCPLHSYP